MAHRQIMETSNTAAIVQAGERHIAQMERISYRGRLKVGIHLWSADLETVATPTNQQTTVLPTQASSAV